MAALCDDVNTPGAIAAMRGLADAALAGDAAAAAGLLASGALLGVLQQSPDAWFGRVAAEQAADQRRRSRNGRRAWQEGFRQGR